MDKINGQPIYDIEYDRFFPSIKAAMIEYKVSQKSIKTSSRFVYITTDEYYTKTLYKTTKLLLKL